MCRSFIVFLLLTTNLISFAQTKLSNEEKLSISEKVYASNPDSSFKLSIEVETNATNDNDKKNLAKAKSFIGRYYLLKSDLEESNIKLLESYNLYKELNDLKGQAYVLKLRSILLDRIGNEKESTETLENAISLYRKANDTTGLVAALLNISLDYINSKNFHKTNEIFKEIESLVLSEINQFYLHQNKGTYYTEIGEYKNANIEFFKAKSIAQKNKMIDSEATIYKLIGNAHLLNKEYKLSEAYLLQSKNIAEQNNLDNELIEACSELIVLYEKQERFKDAFDILRLQNNLNNKILNIEKINRITSLEKKLALAEKEKEIQQANANTQKLVYVLIGIALLLCFALYMFFRTSSLKNKISNQNQILEEQNILVEHQKNIVEVKQKEILDSIHYAKRIQESLLPSDKYIEKHLLN